MIPHIFKQKWVPDITFSGMLGGAGLAMLYSMVCMLISGQESSYLR